MRTTRGNGQRKFESIDGRKRGGCAVTKILAEIGPDNGVVGGSGNLARRDIDFGGMASRGHDSGGHYMVDAPAAVSLEGVAEEIPVGVLNDIGVKLAEDIDESPGNDFLVSVAGVDVEIGIVHAFFR